MLQIIQQFNINQIEIQKLTNALYKFEFQLEIKNIKLQELENKQEEIKQRFSSVKFLIDCQYQHFEVDIKKIKNEIVELHQQINLLEEKIKSLQILKIEIYCPKCNEQHIDKNEWETKQHKTHLCEYCGNEWRPFDFPTVGILKEK